MQFQRVIIALFALSMLSLHISPAVASISMGLLLLISLTYFLKPNVLGVFSTFSNSKSERLNRGNETAVIIWSAILFVGMMGVEWYHGCSPSGIKVIKNFLPMFFLPFLGWLFAGMDARNFKKDLNWLRPTLNIPLIWMVIASSLEYLSHHRFYSAMILESKPMPLFSRVYHIEFSLIIAMQLLFTLFLYRNELFQKDGRWMIQTEMVLLFLGLHFLSARTGLLSFWVGALFLFSGDIRSISKKWVLLGMMVVVTLILSLSSIRNRLINTWEDLSAVVQGDDLNHKSFGQRWESWKAGVHLIKEHPVLGVGPCRFNEMHQQAYKTIGSGLRAENRIGPHNQWIQWIAEYGWCIIGFILVYLWHVFRVSQNTKNQVLISPNLQENPIEMGDEKTANRINSIRSLVFALVACLIMASMFESILERQAGMWMLIFALAVKNIPKK